MAKPICETARLRLRELHLGDAHFIVELLNDPDFLRFIGDRGVRDVETAQAYLRNGPLASYEQHGHGLWLVELRDDGTPIGICGMLRRDALDAPDIGFAYLAAYRGQGYGHEAAHAVLDHGRNALGMDRVVAVTQANNAASIALLSKLGMRREGAVQLDAGGPQLLRFAIRLGEADDS